MGHILDVEFIYNGIRKVLIEAELDEKCHVWAMLRTMYEMIKRDEEKQLPDIWKYEKPDFDFMQDDS